MKISTSLLCSAVVILMAVANSPAGSSDVISRRIRPSKDTLVFPNSKGEVVFSHSQHLSSLNNDGCLNCHRTDNPTLENIQSRFENHRVAHSFCKGCHRELGKGPTECHQCHNIRKPS